MPVTFKIPKSPSRSVETISDFRGVDLSNSPASCEKNKSPDAVNMIRDVPGKVRKRTGYQLVRLTDDGTNRTYADFSSYGSINGYHRIRNADHALIHAGTYLLKVNDNGTYSVLRSDLNDAISHSWQFMNTVTHFASQASKDFEVLYILDGKKFLQYYLDNGSNQYVCEPVENSYMAYVPTVTIAKSPSGGGQSYEPVNLLSSYFQDMFQGTATDVDYQMTFTNLTQALSHPIQVFVMDSDGNFPALPNRVEGVDYTVNYTTGVVTFVNPPGVSPITGEDNVKIKAWRVVPGYSDRINKCTIGTRFGVNGAFDRLFVSGNPDFLNADWYSQQWNLAYFPDTGSSRLGSSKSAIVGYSIISNYIAAHKDEQEQDLSIILRSGDMVDNKPSFRIINTLQGPGAIAQNSFAYLCTEPIFLTRSGVYAVTAQDITGEKYSQSRSFFVNEKLTNENFSDLQSSFAFVYKDMYFLAVKRSNNEHPVYILDGLQPLRTDKSDPYSTRQYAAFYFDDVPIRCMWEHDGILFFGSESGKVFKFKDNVDALETYADEYAPDPEYPSDEHPHEYLRKEIYCKWETPDIDGQLFYKNKTLRYIAVRLGAAIATSVKIWGMDKGIWNLITTDAATGRYLVFSKITFSKFTFSSDKTQKTLHVKAKIKKVDKFRIRLENDEIDEPFFLYDIGMEYVENGYYKG